MELHDLTLMHYSAKPLGAVHSTQQSTEPGFKPRGIWVSVLGKADWKSWCEAEEFNLAALEYANRIHLAEDAKILWLQTVGDIDVFTHEYANTKFAYGVRWHPISEQYQGIIIAPYQWSRRLDGGANWYYPWDCASGCIWDASAIDKVTLVEEVA